VPSCKPATHARAFALLRGALLSIIVTATGSSGAASCQAISGAQVPQVVELYTSEGCSSCPPADRWLTTLKDRTDVLAAAFHVDYWDGLGWADRFASPRHTQRQRDTMALSGARFAYTPQVLVNGRDWRRWPDLPQRPSPATVQVRLVREQPDGPVTTAVIEPLATTRTTPPRLALWWALVEDAHVTPVRRGENAGATLHHDRVVRAYGTVPAWQGAQRVSIPAVPDADTAHPRHLLAVVTDAASGAPVQAVQLACP